MRSTSASVSRTEVGAAAEAGHALILPNFLLPSFDIQEREANPEYWFLCCRTCKLTWNLPKNPTRRAKDAITILADHAAMHREADSRYVTTPPSESACAVCGGTDGPFERATYIGAPSGGVPVHFDCVAAFFDQLDGCASKHEHVTRDAHATLNERPLRHRAKGQ
jgi:hypothetical protein